MFSNTETDAASARIRKPLGWIFKGAFWGNVLFLPSLLLAFAVPEIFVLGYLIFYYFIWLFLPACGVMLVLLYYGKRQGLAADPVAAELKWCTYA